MRFVKEELGGLERRGPAVWRGAARRFGGQQPGGLGKMAGMAGGSDGMAGMAGERDRMAGMAGGRDRMDGMAGGSDGMAGMAGGRDCRDSADCRDTRDTVGRPVSRTADSIADCRWRFAQCSGLSRYVSAAMIPADARAGKMQSYVGGLKAKPCLPPLRQDANPCLDFWRPPLRQRRVTVRRIRAHGWCQSETFACSRTLFAYAPFAPGALARAILAHEHCKQVEDALSAHKACFPRARRHGPLGCTARFPRPRWTEARHCS